MANTKKLTIGCFTTYVNEVDLIKPKIYNNLKRNGRVNNKFIKPNYK